ncbi:MAG TPA: hypothetical protein VHQ65_12985 [Thermoanaerobaculia bacterium]|nr:hypothetical protein [Thermoanaerobaculia bacterium]
MTTSTIRPLLPLLVAAILSLPAVAAGGAPAGPLPWEARPAATPLPPLDLEAVTAAGTAACDDNSDGDGTWPGCRGTGCHVCAEKVSSYPCYYLNHPNCVENTTCGGRYYDCDSSCPAPTEADRCASTSCQTDTCWSCSQPALGVDADADAVPDRLEYDLAHQFFPSIKLQGFSDDLANSYLYKGWAIPYTVQPLAPTSICNETLECLEIRFGIAYDEDTGDGLGWTSHPGDSEFYAVLVQRTTAWSSASGYAGYWRILRDFTAAHWGDSGDSSRYGAYGSCPPYCGSWDNSESQCNAHSNHCNWFPGLCSGVPSNHYGSCSQYWDEGSCYFAGCTWYDSSCYNEVAIGCYSSSPVATYRTLYAAEGKHALYHTDNECENGGYFDADACPYNAYDMRSSKGQKLQNVGSRSNHAGFDTYIQHPDGCKLYYVWGGDRFAGSTEYRKHFMATLTWDLP